MYVDDFLFHLDIRSSIKHPTAKHWHPHAVLLFQIFVCLKLKIGLESTVGCTALQIQIQKDKDKCYRDKTKIQCSL